MDTLTIAIVGQPNVGKSSLINALTNAQLKVGNFAGVTVEAKKIESIFKYKNKDYKIELIDLPGIYSLKDFTTEEKVTKNFLENEEYDLILNIVDATHLQRSLMLTAQLMELGKKMVVALNMMDEAKKEGIEINTKLLSKILGVPVVEVSAKTKEGIEELKEKIIEAAHSNIYPKMVYSDYIEEEIDKIVNFLKEKHFKFRLPLRNLAILLLKEDRNIYKELHDEPIWIELLPLIRSALEHIYLHAQAQDIEEIFTQEYIAFAKGAKEEVLKCPKRKSKNITQKIDSILLNKYLGIPIFLILMWLLFQATFTLGEVPVELLDNLFNSLANYIKDSYPNGSFTPLIADGIIKGVGGVIEFLPNIIILFIGIALLETTGYMARVSFLLDGFFHKFGLHGKSFIPLITGFGCTVPAYMAARTLKNRSDRLITMFILSFFSCSARVPVYVLFISIFFPSNIAGNALFIIYITGAILGLIAAKILRKFFFSKEDEPFVMELPKYRIPSFKLIFHIVYDQAKEYLAKAGTWILLAAILIWYGSHYPKNEALINQYNKKIEIAKDKNQKDLLEKELQAKLLEESYLGKIGKFSEPFFEPLGFNWKLSVALESGLAAKEVIVSTLGVLYATGDNEKGLKEALKKEISIPTVIAFIIFVMIYLPCFAASAVFVKESGSFKYLIYQFIFTTFTAWIFAFLGYNLTKLIIGA